MTGVPLTTYSSQHRDTTTSLMIFALEKNVDPIDPVQQTRIPSIHATLVRVHCALCVYVLCTIEKKGKGRGAKRERERERRGTETIRFRKLANQGSTVNSDVKAVCSKLLYHIQQRKARETRSSG